jgi:hypothetical protein
MSENIKNWVIGVLVVLVIFLGAKFLTTKNSQPTPTFLTPTSIIEQTVTPSECISAQEAWNYVGQEKCVEYYVASPFRSGKGNVFLNEKRDYKNGFTVWIPAGSISNFSGDPVSTYGYKTIQVTGQIRMYQGHPEIIANGPDQISVK